MLLSEKSSLIKLKVQALLQQQEALKRELLLVQTEANNLREIVSEQTKRIEILEDKNKISKLADGIQLNGKKQTELKHYLNSHIHQIDECLKLLNQLSDNT